MGESKVSLSVRILVICRITDLHLLRALDVADKAIFTSVPDIDFKNERSLRDHLVWVVLHKADAEGRSKPCRENVFL